MTELLELYFKITMINMLRPLMEKVDKMQEQTGNISREVKIKESKGNMRNKNTNNTNRNKECF